MNDRWGLVKEYWPKGISLPSNELIDKAYARWQKEAESDTGMSDFYFEFGFTLATYNPGCWMYLFKADGGT